MDSCAGFPSPANEPGNGKVIEFFRRTPAIPRRLGIFPGTFNPPTHAHLALARAAEGHVDEVLFVTGAGSGIGRAASLALQEARVLRLALGLFGSVARVNFPFHLLHFCHHSAYRRTQLRRSFITNKLMAEREGFGHLRRQYNPQVAHSPLLGVP
jgi:Cytidylyltransferase-like